MLFKVPLAPGGVGVAGSLPPFLQTGLLLTTSSPSVDNLPLLSVFLCLDVRVKDKEPKKMFKCFN